MNQVTVIAVLGLSYCGSTLLNFMLDSHPDIYGGGELLWLLRKKYGDGATNVQCTHCHEHCSFWTPEALSEVCESRFYDYIGGLFNVRVLVDTSKNPSWFENIRKHPSNREAHFVYVILTKHPIRHIASFFTNTLYRKSDDYLLNALARLFSYQLPLSSKGRSQAKMFIDKRLKKRFLSSIIRLIYGYYYNLFMNIARTSGGSPVQVIQYENLVACPEVTLSPVLELCGLEYVSSMQQCFKYPHHQIGGNAGPIYQASHSRIWGDADDPGNALRKKQYDLHSGIFLDNKYQKLFDSHEIRWLSSIKSVSSLCKMLGYNTLP